VIRRAGLNTGTGRGGPRVHDLRHTFVVHRVTAWYRQGINPQNRLPYLSAYLDHRDIHSTLVYLTITQELLQHANNRFRAAEAGCAEINPRRTLVSKTALPTLARLLYGFFREWLVEQRNVSQSAVVAYRDAWRLFLRFIAKRQQRQVAALRLEHLTEPEVLA